MFGDSRKSGPGGGGATGPPWSIDSRLRFPAMLIMGVIRVLLRTVERNPGTGLFDRLITDAYSSHVTSR